MTPYYADEWLTVYASDCRTVMAEMPEQSVHCVVTSPPYWGLRDYGTATWTGGGFECGGRHEIKADAAWWSKSHEEIRRELEDEAAEPLPDEDHCPVCAAPRCDHVEKRQPQSLAKLADRHAPRVNPRNPNRQDDEQINAVPYRDVCGKCGALRVDGQIGLESTPDAYVETIVAVFREVRRVLRDDGTVWLNLGDSYTSGNSGQRVRNTNGGFGGSDGERTQDATRANPGRAPVMGAKPKDLVGIPWRVAFALQADGWYLRSDVVWSKPNPMPESVTDRPTKSHEYVFLLSKRERYYFDADAVREGFADARMGNPGGGTRFYAPGDRNDGTDSRMLTWDKGAERGGRNLRSVWTIATQPYPGAHFATFPEALVEPCVKAGTSERGVCPDCGAPWVRVVDATKYQPPIVAPGVRVVDESRGDKTRKLDGHVYNAQVSRQTTGWRASCRHDAEPVPATVLDPFAGSGTTGRVAQRLGRRAILVDLSPAYLVQAMVRNRDIPLGLGVA